MKTCRKGLHQYDDGLKRCPECHNIISKAYHIKNRDKSLSQKKAYYLKNRDKSLSQKKAYYLKNKDRILTYSKAYHASNKERVSSRAKTYCLKNKDRIRTQSKAYYSDNRAKLVNYSVQYKKTRRLVDPFFKLKESISSLVRDAFRRRGYKKTAQTHEILGCSFEELENHLHSTWEKNYGTPYAGQSCHIDHIIPISSAQSEQDVLKLNHYTNLQLLTPEDNLTKGDKIFGEI
jgi:hypothetical protein